MVHIVLLVHACGCTRKRPPRTELTENAAVEQARLCRRVEDQAAREPVHVGACQRVDGVGLELRGVAAHVRDDVRTVGAVHL